MPSDLDFTPRDDGSRKAEASRHDSGRDPNPVVQMSIRMKEDVCERFRKHCISDRRTNGDMLEEMMAAHERESRRRD